MCTYVYGELFLYCKSKPAQMYAMQNAELLISLLSITYIEANPLFSVNVHHANIIQHLLRGLLSAVVSSLFIYFGWFTGLVIFQSWTRSVVQVQL